MLGIETISDNSVKVLLIETYLEYVSQSAGIEKISKYFSQNTADWDSFIIFESEHWGWHFKYISVRTLGIETVLNISVREVVIKKVLKYFGQSPGAWDSFGIFFSQSAGIETL